MEKLYMLKNQDVTTLKAYFIAKEAELRYKCLGFQREDQGVCNVGYVGN